MEEWALNGLTWLLALNKLKTVAYHVKHKDLNIFFQLFLKLPQTFVTLVFIIVYYYEVTKNVFAF